ncbi:hypothetical protein [Siminovitchia sp. 179-K 8D1 HS]|uniref:hypothetical protein n=1 Tax=Siminovitchia sp. 179-K 8D1 HS TaxID=3142385 RepID=UPI0039A21E4E
MDRINQYTKEVERKIHRLEKELQQISEDLTRRIDGDHRTIMSHGLARDAEKITVIHAKLEELYDMRDTLYSIFESVD